MAKLLTLLLILAPLLARPLAACELALVMALDVSRSVDKQEYRLMRNGIAHAFIDDEVIQLISWLPGGVTVTVSQWGGTGHQHQVIGWRHLSDRASVLSFVEELSRIERVFLWSDTSVSEALLHADSLFADNPVPCKRRVIDVSTDGISNSGPPVQAVSLGIGLSGTTINGLVVTGHRPDPVAYFYNNVTSGPLPFVVVTNSYDDYPRAMKRKLLREMAPVLGMVTSE
ncbi:MAG: DUF1194 domain-containing protein [Alphaproteobacteria bacterium]|nr:DUF1194 domain-containing protein [Alphaproteobacteria bacterium]